MPGMASSVRTLALESVYPSAASPCTQVLPHPADMFSTKILLCPCSGGKDGSLRRYPYESGRRMAAEVPFGQLHTLAAGVLVE